MPIPFLSLFGKKQEPTYFLVLVLRHEKIQAVLLEEQDGKISLKGEGQSHFHDSIEEADEQTFLTHLDEAITNAESTLTVDIPTHKTVFGVLANWVEDAKIKKPYLAKLKKACDELGLSPVGFLVIPEAIIHLMKQEEGVPISTILVDVEKKSVAVFLVKAGKILESKRAHVEKSYAQTVDELLKQFEEENILPSRITLFNDDRNEEALLQAFITHSWSKSLPFLHMPQIASLPKNISVRAVISASSIQMGFDTLTTLPQETTKEKQSLQPRENTKTVPASKENPFGFIRERDITLESQQEVLPQETPATQEIQDPQPSFKQVSFLSYLTPVKTAVLKRIGVMSNVRSVRLPLFLNAFVSFGGPKLFLTLFITIVVLGIGAWVYLFAFKATAAIIIDPRFVKQTENIIFSTTQASNPASNILNAQTVSVTEAGSHTILTTGKKEVGEKARGTVTIYGRFNQEQTLSKGTVFTSSNGLEFLLDETVHFASTSADASSAPSTAKATISASDIGKEFNLPSDTKFSVEKFDAERAIAKNESAFSGGSKKEIKVVGKDDAQKLLEALPNKLEEKAKEEVQKKASKDQEVLSTFIKKTVTESTFSKKVGDEAESISLEGVVEYEGLLYNRDELMLLALNLLGNQFPSNLTIGKENMKKTVQNVRVDKGEIQASISFMVPLIPKLDPASLSKTLAGKPLLEANDILLRLPQVVDARITLFPPLPFLGSRLPIRAQNITIQTRVNE